MTEFMKALIISWVAVLLITGMICWTCLRIKTMELTVDMEYLRSVPQFVEEETKL